MKKIVHYDAKRLLLLLPEFGLSGGKYDTWHHLIHMFGEVPIIDRTGSTEPILPFKITDPLPNVVKTGDFRSVSIARACELLKLSRESNREINFYWSGGIDSTAALCAFLQATDDLDSLVVVCNYKAYAEYPAFYEKYIAGKLRVSLAPGVTSSAIKSDVITVTGEHGDQLFGSVLMNRFAVAPHAVPFVSPYPHDAGALQMDALTMIGGMFVEASFDRNGAKRIREFLEPLINYAPFKIITIYDLLWWLNFTLKWQDVRFRMTTNCPQRVEGVVSFYGSDEFQSWAMNEDNHRTEKIDFASPKPWSTYKLAARRAIVALTKDESYAFSKPKVPSLGVMNSIDMALRFDDNSIATFQDIANNPDQYKTLLSAVGEKRRCL